MASSKDNTIVISAENWNKGIADSPFEGMGKIVNMDIYSHVDSIQMAPALTKSSSTEIDGLVSYFAVNPDTGNVYCCTPTEKVYVYSGGWSQLSGNSAAVPIGLQVYKDYLYYIYTSGGNTFADRYGPFSGTPSWTTNWGTVGNSAPSNCPTVWASDDRMYIGVGSKLTSINSSGTITIGALDLPTQYTINSLKQLGSYILVAATSSLGSAIFPWNPTQTSFSFPVYINRVGFYSLVVQNNIAYFISSAYGEAFLTNLAITQSIKMLGYLTNQGIVDGVLQLGTNSGDQLLGGVYFGLGRTTSATDNGIVGLYQLKNNAWTIHTPSFGDGADAHGGIIGGVQKVGDTELFVAWERATATPSYGTDIYSINNNFPTSYASYFESQFYNVGTKIEPRHFQKVDIILTKALAGTEGIKLQYRTNINDSWTDILNYEYGDASGSSDLNVGAVSSFTKMPVNIPKAQNIQFKFLMTSSGSTTPQLLAVKVY